MIQSCLGFRNQEYIVDASHPYTLLHLCTHTHSIPCHWDFGVFFAVNTPRQIQISLTSSTHLRMPQNVNHAYPTSKMLYRRYTWQSHTMYLLHIIQWKLGITITRSLGPGNLACYIRYFVISVVKKTIQNKGNILIGTREISLLYQVFCYIRSLYIEFPL